MFAPWISLTSLKEFNGFLEEEKRVIATFEGLGKASEDLSGIAVYVRTWRLSRQLAVIVPFWWRWRYEVGIIKARVLVKKHNPLGGRQATPKFGSHLALLLLIFSVT
jgi:hypothetical protein